MILSTQIKLIIFSLIYGMFLSVTLNINYKYIYKTKFIYKLLVSTAYVSFNILLYFYILLKINNGILHYYSFICIVLGFIIVNKIRIWYNQ